MLTRRNFFWSFAAALFAGRVPSVPAQAGALPASLAALPSMKAFSDEPGVYIRGEFEVRREDDLHVTENGAELSTPQSESLEKPF